MIAPNLFDNSFLIPKKKTPIPNVQIGVKALIIPANELDILCCASGYKKAGRNEPIIAIIIMVRYCFLLTFCNALGKKGLNTTALIIILNTDIWIGEKLVRLCLMK